MAEFGIQRMQWHTHRPVLIDYSSGCHWAAVTMLENFHSCAIIVAMGLDRIGAAEAGGSKRQRVAYRLAKWLFDTGVGDGAGL